MMGTQGPGRKRIPNRDKVTAEDDALNRVAREAEARLAAKRAARAEAREIRMKELERQQKEKYYGLDNKWGHIEQWMEDSERYSRLSRRNTSVSDDEEKMSVGSRGSCRPSEPSMFLGSASRASSRTSSARASPVVEEKPDRDFLDKSSRTALTLSASTLTSLGGASSRRGSCDTSFSGETEASIREIKDSLAEAEERYRRAMVSNAQLHNEKSSLMYQVETLREELSDMEEQLWEERRHGGDTKKELELEHQSHSFLQFQFKEMKETLRQTEEMLTEVSELRLQSNSYCQEVSDLQEVLQWKQKKIAALEREREISDIVRIERDRLRDEATQLRGLLKKHGVVVSPEISTNGETGQTEADVTTDSGFLLAQDRCHGSRESMLGNSGARCPAEGSKFQQDDMRKSLKILNRSQSLEFLSDEQTNRDTSHEGVKKRVEDEKKEGTKQMKTGSSVTRLNNHNIKPEFRSSPQGVLVTENKRSFKHRGTVHGGTPSLASEPERYKKFHELVSLVRRSSTKQVVSRRAANRRSNLTRKQTSAIQLKQKHVKEKLMSDFTQTSLSAVESRDKDVKTTSEEQSSGEDKRKNMMIRRENQFINMSSEIHEVDLSENEMMEATDQVCRLLKNSAENVCEKEFSRSGTDVKLCETSEEETSAERQNSQEKPEKKIHEEEEGDVSSEPHKHQRTETLGRLEQTLHRLIRDVIQNHSFLSEKKNSTQEEEEEEVQSSSASKLPSVSAATHKLTHHDLFNVSHQRRSEVTWTSSPEETCDDQRDCAALTTSCRFQFVFVESHFAEPEETRSAESPQRSGVPTETDVNLRRRLSTNRHVDQSSKIRRLIETTADQIKSFMVTGFTTTSFQEGRLDEDPQSSPAHLDETMEGGETLADGVESCEEADEESVTLQRGPMTEVVNENVEVVVVA
ncbi:leucine-rich repeat flightless-interacting protein 2 isoform X2 [Platichthys flesus]|uniref:leucine-rich repeat flightless-interacting protein 2 isoform X2 n=1 Tax=Platichthys flesus TaxID=8260 RepID=UPI002DBCF877|nr:leucine-rich repeat flightless-interacting protein 2 isoform X2 [Platichthys flesus]